jgi:hypothetical protein
LSQPSVQTWLNSTLFLSYCAIRMQNAPNSCVEPWVMWVYTHGTEDSLQH